MLLTAQHCKFEVLYLATPGLSNMWLASGHSQNCWVLVWNTSFIQTRALLKYLRQNKTKKILRTEMNSWNSIPF